MERKNIAVLGIYRARPDVERAVDDLKSEGFSAADISVLMPDLAGSQTFAHVKGTKAPEGAATGAGTGAVIGGTLGLLVGIGALAIPGVGPFIAAGPIMGALAGAGVGGTVGGVTGALIGLGMPEYEAKKFESFVKDGGILLSVHADTSEEVARAKKCLVRTGASDISSTSESTGSWVSSSDNKVNETSGASNFGVNSRLTSAPSLGINSTIGSNYKASSESILSKSVDPII